MLVLVYFENVNIYNILAFHNHWLGTTKYIFTISFIVKPVVLEKLGRLIIPCLSR